MVEDKVVAIVNNVELEDASSGEVTRSELRTEAGGVTRPELYRLLVDEIDAEYQMGNWTPDIRESFPECVATYMIEALPRDVLDIAVETGFPGEWLLGEAEDLLPEDEFATAYVECVGTSEDFVFVYASDWAEPAILECLASGLTIPQRVELVFEYSQFHYEWESLVAACS